MTVRILSAFLVPVILCALAPSAHAIDKCRAKVDKKTGVIRVDAFGVDGALTWGAEAGSESQTFANAGTCVAGTKAKKCELADPETLDAKTPPAGCTIYLADASTPCSAWVPGCSPAVRESGEFLWKDSTGTTVGFVNDSGNSAIRRDGAVLVSIPVNPEGDDFAARGYLNYTSSDCSGTPLVVGIDSFIRPVQNVSPTGPAYYPTDSGTLTTVGSNQTINDTFVDQTACDAHAGAPGFLTHVPPFGCCQTLGGSLTLSATATVDLSFALPPFQIAEQ